MLMICVIVSHNKETITSFIESLNNGPEHFLSTDEGSFKVATTINLNVDLGGGNNQQLHQELTIALLNWFFV